MTKENKVLVNRLFLIEKCKCETLATIVRTLRLNRDKDRVYVVNIDYKSLTKEYRDIKRRLLFLSVIFKQYISLRMLIASHQKIDKRTQLFNSSHDGWHAVLPLYSDAIFNLISAGRGAIFDIMIIISKTSNPNAFTFVVQNTIWSIDSTFLEASLQGMLKIFDNFDDIDKDFLKIITTISNQTTP